MLAIETPGLGSPNRWGQIKQNGYSHTSTVEEDMLRDMEKSWKVDVITRVLGQIDPTSKKIIEEWYFRDIMTREEIQESLSLDKNKFYYFRNRTLKKFMAALNYI